MPFLRFTRDKRGYEYFYLVQPTQRRGKSSARVLYWYRTPPDVKVGREPFDEAIRRELEKQNPDVVFEWRKILETPIPSADAEKWRDRRRAERAAKVARRGEAPGREAADATGGDEEAGATLDEAAEENGDVEDEAAADVPLHGIEAAIEAVSTPEAPESADAADASDQFADETSNEGGDTIADAAQAETPAAESVELRAVGSTEPLYRKRRRRRRRPGRSGPQGPTREPPAGSGGDV